MGCSLLALRVTVLAILCTNAYSYLQEYPSRSANDSRTPLYFGLVQSFGGDYNGRGAVAGVQVALDRINDDRTLLPGYSLHYTLTDSQCNRTVALDAFFQQIIREPVKIALIGSGCSLATEPTAEVSHYYNITHISCVSSSTELVDKARFKFYYQLLPTEADIAPAYYGVIKRYGWRHVELIVQNENLFTVTMDRLKVLLKADNITYSERIFESTDSIAGLGPNPFDSESRIFIIATYSVHARPLLCEAYRRGIQYPRYLLLTYAWYSPRWWIQEDPELTCTAADRESVLPFSLAFLQFDFLQHLGLNLTSDTGITGNQYFDEEKAFLDVPPLNLTQIEYAQYCYDATWTLAYALNQTISELETDPIFQSEAREAAMLNDTFSLEDFRYDNNVVLRNIMKYVANTTFNGVTGPVSFQADGIRAVNTLRVMQLRSIENDTGNGTYVDWVEIGQVLDSGQGHAFTYLDGKSDDTVWPNGLIPYDGVPVEEDVSVTLSVTVIFFILSSAGIVFAIVCLIFNFIFRNRKLVRLSSPNLNYLIGAGAIVLYVDIYLFVIPTTDPDAVAVLCNLTSWFTALGYSLCYGTILAKMWRVYYIFNNPKPKKKMALKDWMLSITVLILVVVDISILVIFMAVEGSNGNLEAKRIPNRENRMDIKGELGIVTLYYVYICDTKERDIFLGILYGYKALLTVVTLVLAFQTRKVKVKGLNDAKYIAAAIYITSIVLAVVMVSTYSLKEYINIFASVFCTGFFIGTTFILALVFVPKMVGLYQDPSGESIFSSKGALSTPGMPKVPPPTRVESSSDKETIASLQRKLEELQTVISRNQKPGGEVELSSFGEATPVDYSITGEISGKSTNF